MSVLDPPPNSPLKVELCASISPLLEGLLVNAIQDCPQDFAAQLAQDFSDQVLADRVIHLLRQKPELLEHLYPGAAEA